MNHRTGLDRSQTLLFPERLEDYGLQPQTGAEPGELRETDVHPSQNCFGGRGGAPPSAVLLRRTGGSESPAKSLKRGGGALFSFRWLPQLR